MDRLFPTRTPGPRGGPPSNPPLLPRHQRIREFSGLLGGVPRPVADRFGPACGPQAVRKIEAPFPTAASPPSSSLEPSAKPPELLDGPKRDLRTTLETSSDPAEAELDPTSRMLFQLRPPEATGAPPPPPTAHLERAAESLLRTIGWGRSGTRTHVQLRVGEGRFANAAITLESDAHQRVTVRLVAGADVDVDALGAVLRSRFERGGLAVDLELETS